MVNVDLSGASQEQSRCDPDENELTFAYGGVDRLMARHVP